MRPACVTLIGALICSSSARATVLYSIDDGRAELTIGIDPGEDQIWMNTFPVAAGGEVMTSIQVAFGRQGIGTPLNGLAVKALLYEDADGGSPQNAVLKASVNGVVANANSNTFVQYAIPPTEIHGTLVAACLYRNLSAINRPIAALDQTAPSLANRSFGAFTTNGLDETDLASIPAAQFFPIETVATGNFLLRAVGQPIPEPIVGVLPACFPALAARRGGQRDSARHPVR